MPSFRRSRFPGLLLNVIALATTFVSFARAQTTTIETASAAPTRETVQLDKYVVSASRTPQDPKYVSSSVTVLPLEELATAQVSDLSTALKQAPGVTVVGYGGSGSASTVYIRGGSNNQTLVVVDGVRMSSRQTDFMGRGIVGNTGIGGFQRIEILRGPQGTLYGSSAMGGVIVMETARGCGATAGVLTVGGGSFQTAYGQAGVQGGTKNFGYTASLGYGSTANYRPDNDSKHWNYATRLEGKPTESLLVGITFRGVQDRYEEPGSISYKAPGAVDSNGYLASAYAEFSAGDVFKSRLTTGWHQSDYFWLDLSGSPWAANAYYRNTRNVLDWQNTWTPSATVTVVAGVNADKSFYTYKGSPPVGVLKDDAHGVYLSSDLHLVDQLSITAGLRYDHFKTSGNATTGRLGSAWRVENTDTKFRATVGTGFSAPGMTERFGQAPWYAENASLRPEKSTGWDVGVDQSLLEGDLTIEATYFQNKFHDMIVANPVVGLRPFQYQNIARARTEGVEFAASAKLTHSLKLRVASTYLDVYDTTGTQPARVAYKPRKSGDADLQWQATCAWTMGTGVHYVADRMRTATDRISDYSTVRLYTSYEVVKNLTLKLRVENAFDHNYEEIYGYPALSRGVFGGVEWRF